MTRLGPASIILGVLLCLVSGRLMSAEKPEVQITYVSLEDDEAFNRQRRYTGLILRQQYPLLGAVKSAIKESKIVGRALGVRFTLDQLKLKRGMPVGATALRHHQNGGAIYVLDLPLPEMIEVGKAFSGKPVLLFNPRSHEPKLRRQNCQIELFHTLPSRAMMMDALAQFLRARNWTRVLALIGEHPNDAPAFRVFERSAGKFGLNIIDRRPFTLRNDPRERDQNNIALLTQGRYDVVFVSDETGEFGRYVPYQTALPRPVVGAHGLQVSAWHWTWERYGAPQLNQRFARRNKRQMNGRDWAAWAAVRSVVEAVARTKKSDAAAIASFLRDQDFVLDAYKGTPASFRKWNNQLRQPILLHTHDAVINSAPLGGFLHETNTLDTLGDDRSDANCVLR
ncbi:MAG: amino acid ABC transporter substrate-binding protein [Rhodobacteraceae bacterium]|nr:amino acid ABC transporter substrate-binding protein [Paracoccaceae bacterium]